MKISKIYLDMDGVVVNLGKSINKIRPDLDPNIFHSDIDGIFESHPTIFHDAEPMEGAISSAMELFRHFDVYFLSTPAWNAPQSFTGKRIWLEKHFGGHAERRLILTHRKDLAIGDFLVDDTLRHGVDEFKGVHIHFGTKEFPNWKVTLPHLINLSTNPYPYASRS